MGDTKTYPARFPSYEAWRAYRNAWQQKYRATEKGKEAMRRDNSGPKALARLHRYRATEKGRATYERGRVRGIERAKAYQAQLRLIAPEKIQARSAVAIAVRQGLARPTECERCGKTKRLDAHHHKGYAQRHWLDVQWLCRSCHRYAHAPSRRTQERDPLRPDLRHVE